MNIMKRIVIPLTVHVRHLREKMGDAIDEPRYIKTVWGVGYKIEN